MQMHATYIFDDWPKKWQGQIFHVFFFIFFSDDNEDDDEDDLILTTKDKEDIDAVVSNVLAESADLPDTEELFKDGPAAGAEAVGTQGVADAAASDAWLDVEPR